MRLVVINHVTLDGVLQGPGRPGEDTRGGFSHSGWAIPHSDEVMGRELGKRMGRPDGGLLLGRWSYEEMLGYWNAGGGQFKILYKGKVTGQDIKFHVVIGDFGEGDLLAKRSS